MTSSSNTSRIIGNGEMASRVRAYDWSGTPLGPIESWSKELLTIVNLTLSSPSPARTMWGPDLILIYNDAYRPFPGPRHPWALGKSAREVYTESWSVVGPLLENAVTTGETLFYERLRVPLPSANGTRDAFLNYSFNTIFENGKIAGLFGHIHDVTGEVTAESQLRESEARSNRQLAEIETVYRTAPIGLALFDTKDFRYLRLNDRQAAFFGLKPEDVVGKTLTEMAPIEGLRELFEQVARGEPVINFPLEGTLVTDPDDYRYWNVSYFPVYAVDGSIQAITAASLEVTAQRKAEAALIDSEKLAVLGRLAASIAHEINNPLEALTNLLYLAQNNDNLAEVRNFLDTAERELRRVSAITSQTLRFYKQASSPQAVTAASLFESVLTVYQGRTINTGVVIERRDSTSTSVNCFDGEIRQVISNLFCNALEAMGSECRRILLRSREATHWPSGERGIVLTIADTGVGMGPETMARIFKPFFTTKGVTGTGLGLWVSKEIVDRHHGSLTIRSSNHPRHRGTVCCLFLPFNAVTREDQ